MNNIHDLSPAAQAVYCAMRAAALPTSQTIPGQTWLAFYTHDFYQKLYAQQPVEGFDFNNDKQVASYLAVLNRRGLYVGQRIMPMARVRVS